ncbi:MAG: LytR/AlgR family response regulator transcription factor [Saprospiraceae bacterium]
MRYPIRCVVLEDEADWRMMFCELLSSFAEVKIVGQAENVDDAFFLVAQERPQAIFMDIELEGGNAFSLLDRLAAAHVLIPPIVIITGFPAYAVNALNHYKEYVVKFLTKPMLENWQEKLRDALEAIIAKLLKEAEKGSFLIRTENSFECINFEDLAWVDVYENGKVCVMTDHSEGYLVNLTLTQFMHQYAFSPLRRINRRESINKNRIIRIVPAERTVTIRFENGEKVFGIGDTFYNDLINELQ